MRFGKKFNTKNLLLRRVAALPESGWNKEDFPQRGTIVECEVCPTEYGWMNVNWDGHGVLLAHRSEVCLIGNETMKTTLKDAIVELKIASSGIHQYKNGSERHLEWIDKLKQAEAKMEWYADEFDRLADVVSAAKKCLGVHLNQHNEEMHIRLCALSKAIEKLDKGV